MRYAIAQCKPDAVLHLGDHIHDAHEIARKHPDLPFHMVEGNCDMEGSGDTELLLTFDGVTIFMTHGHEYCVKRGLGSFIDRAHRKGVNLALYGHTHNALIQETLGIWIMNPGQLIRHDKSHVASYGVVTIENGAFTCELAYLPLSMP